MGHGGYRSTVRCGLLEGTVMERTLSIICSQCGNWEEQPADQPRHAVQGFALVECMEDGNGRYRCTSCGNEVVSSITEGVKEWVK